MVFDQVHKNIKVLAVEDQTVILLNESLHSPLVEFEVEVTGDLQGVLGIGPARVTVHVQLADLLASQIALKRLDHDAFGSVTDAVLTFLELDRLVAPPASLLRIVAVLLEHNQVQATVLLEHQVEKYGRFCLNISVPT